MISPADFVGLPTKVEWLLALFSNSESDFCMTFVLATCRPTTHGVGAEAFDIHKSKVK